MSEYRDDHKDRGGRGGAPGRGRSPGHAYAGDRERRGIPLSDLDPVVTEASRRVIGCAIDVHKALGPGFDSSVYARALMIELGAQGVVFKADYRIPVKYKDQEVGEACADLFVQELFLVSVTARPGEVGTPERMTLRGQLKAAGLDLGLIINFAERRLKDGLVRVLNIDKINLDRDGEDDLAGPDRAQDFESGA